MAKAINWPKEFYEEVIQEDQTSPKIAVRIGSILFDNAYFSDGEIIDIRVNHKIVRKGMILGEAQLKKIKELTDEDFSMCKKSMYSKSNLISFLSNNYNLLVNDETSVTVITYKNLDLAPLEDDDPHM